MSTPFLAPDAGREDARLRLVCLPYAGGGVGLYRDWPAAMPEGVEVLPVRLPGRENRLRDTPFRSMPALADALWADLRPYLDRPWALFGHSMGGAVAWELAVRGQAEGREPAHLHVSARRAPGLPLPHPPMFALPEPELIAQTERLYGPFPAGLKARPAMLRTFLPTLRADMQVIDTWQPSEGVLAAPITVYGGADDVTVPAEAREAWRARTTGPVAVHVLPGDHFHVRTSPACRDLVATALADTPSSRS